MKFSIVLAVSVALSVSTSVAAPVSPYAGEEAREVKALSTEETKSYLSGEGMGLAKAAELNGYPGPSHVLALGADLGLAPEQRRQTEMLFGAMHERAIGVGRQLVDEERKLDEMFAGKAVTPERLSASLQRIGALQGELRGVHLEAHLEQVRILTPAQVARYMALRGYAGAQASPAHEMHRH